MTLDTQPNEISYRQPPLPPDSVVPDVGTPDVGAPDAVVPDVGAPDADSPQSRTPAAKPTRLRFPFPWPPSSRQLLTGLAILGGVGLVVFALRPAPHPADLVTVERGDLLVTVAAEGKTRVRDRYVVAAPVEGRLARIDLTVGDTVGKGAVVAQIDPLPLNSQVQQAQAQLRALQAQIAGVETLRPKQDALEQAQARIRSAQAQQQAAVARLAQAEATWQQAQRELQRADDLLARGAISQQAQEDAALAATARQKEWEAARQARDSTSSEVKAAQSAYGELQAEQQDPEYLVTLYQAQMASVEAELARLADEANRTRILSPVEGQVLRILEESARFVAAGTPLMELGNPQQLELVIDVLSTDAVNIQPGDAIQIQQWGGAGTLAARVRTIEPAAFTEISALGVEEQRVNVIGDFTAPPVPLGDNYQVDAQIVIEDHKDVLKVPISAVFPCDAEDCVFVVQDQRAVLQPLTIGPHNVFDAVVQAGLQAGDTVIAYPEAIEAGDRVTPRSRLSR